MMPKIQRTAFVCFLFSCFFVFFAEAGEIMEGFDSPNLDPNLWKITTAGKASHKIENGKLILTSDAVEDGVFLYYIKKIGQEDITIEVTVDPSGIKDAGVIGFIKDIINPTVNTKVNENFLDSFMGVKPSGCYLFDDNGKANLDMKADYNPEPHVFKIEAVADKISFSVDQKVIGELKREAQERYFIITSDPYTSHYAGSLSVDSIRMTGAGLAVKPEAGLTTTWAKIRLEE